jgi:ribosomal protein S18 acetylase RimI-like enzyme
MPMFTIRPIDDTDVEATIELWRRAGLLRPWNDPHKDITFARANPNAVVLLALDADRVLGSALVGQDGHRGWVYYVAVDPDRQKQGIGRLIMTAAEDWLIERGIWKVQLLVRSGNEPATAFYEQLGYGDTRSVCLQKVLSER